MKNHFQCFSQHRRDIATYKRPSQGRKGFSLNDFERASFNHSAASAPQFFKNGVAVTPHRVW